MKSLFHEHKGFWNTDRRISMWFGLALLVFAVVIQIVLGHYSAARAVDAPGVGDVFLDNLPLVDMSPIIVGGAMALWTFAWLIFFVHPRYLLFGTKAIALYIISRAFFFSLTHVGPFPLAYSPSPVNHGYGLYHLLTFQGNFFYSGHTGFPFLLALIFWDRPVLRRLFLALTVFFGLSVLLAHVHYSIDVFAAPFIVYGMFAVSRHVFHEDYALIAGHKRS